MDGEWSFSQVEEALKFLGDWGITDQVQLWKAPVLIKYCDIIHSAYNSFLGLTWLCNKMFCMWESLASTMVWDFKDTEF